MPIVDSNIVGERIRRARKKNKITQDELANDLGINRATLSKYEKGVILPPMQKLQAISEYLEVSVSYLVGDTQTLEDAKKSFDYNVMFTSVMEETDKILDILFPGTNTYIIAGENHEEKVTIRGKETNSPFVLSRENFVLLSHLMINLVNSFVEGAGQNPIRYISEIKEYVDSVEPIPQIDKSESVEDFKSTMTRIQNERIQQQEAYYKYIIENCEYKE